jgi:hypothetical protein
MSKQSPEGYRSVAPRDTSRGWVVGIVFFVAIMMFINGFAQFFAGLAAVLGNVPYAYTSSEQVLELSLTAWGWIQLVLGLVVAGAGVMLLTGQRWARVVAIVLAALSAISNFFVVAQYPFWALLFIMLDILVIYALTAHSQDATM